MLRDVDCSLAEGEAVAVIGPNGAGKTTLLRILAGILTPTDGTVELDGQDLGELGRRAVAREVSVVPQARPTAFAFSALEFVLMGFHASSGRFSLDGPGQRDAAHGALAELSVEHLASRPMSALSGGEAQRVVMARTIVSGAKYWLLDEPTASLDLAHQLALLETIERHRDSGGGALAILHDVNLIESRFDRVVVLAGGEVVSGGRPTDVLTSSTLEAVFGVPMRRVADDRGGAWITDVDPARSPLVEPTDPR